LKKLEAPSGKKVTRKKVREGERKERGKRQKAKGKGKFKK